MSGYRQSSFDPNAGGDYGPPLRPFNKWQRVGVGFVVAGVGIMLGVLARRTGLISMDTTDLLPVGTTLCAFGAVFINSRRETLTPEQTARQRRRGLIAVGVALLVCAVVAAIVYFTGAGR